MPARRLKTAAAISVAGVAPLVLTALAAAPAAAHGTMGDPVSRVAQCYAEGPENPKSAACKAAIAAGGTQAIYDWNGIRIGDANGRHQELIPDGRLCSANNDEFQGLDLARTDWPATSVDSGSYTFRYRVTAPHRGTFKVYITKSGYDPSKPLAWSALDLDHPVATATDPVASGGFYTFSGTLPERSGKQLLYAVWQRSDSPEAFYSCSDIAFGGSTSGSGGNTSASGSGSGGGSDAAKDSGTDGGPTPVPAASSPSDEQIAVGADKSSVEHHGHGDDDASTTTDPTTSAAAAPAVSADTPSANRPAADGAVTGLAETGGGAGTPYYAIGGAAVLALGSAALFASVRRRGTAGGGGRGR